MINLLQEIKFQSTRSGGKGGQHVNKVETAVIGSWHIDSSRALDTEQKSVVKEKLSNRINIDGFLQARSQVHRTQLANKEEVTEKINRWVTDALRKKRPRIATRISKAAKERRLESKKQQAMLKSGRRQLRPGEY